MVIKILKTKRIKILNIKITFIIPKNHLQSKIIPIHTSNYSLKRKGIKALNLIKAKIKPRTGIIITHHQIKSIE